MAVFNRDVSSDETLRTAFQKQYVLMHTNDSNQDDHDIIMHMNYAYKDDNDNIADLDTKGISPSFTMMLRLLNADES